MRDVRNLVSYSMHDWTYLMYLMYLLELTRVPYQTYFAYLASNPLTWPGLTYLTDLAY